MVYDPRFPYVVPEGGQDREGRYRPRIDKHPTDTPDEDTEHLPDGDHGL